MEELYKLITEFKAPYSFVFWTVIIIIALSIIILFTFWLTKKIKEKKEVAGTGTSNAGTSSNEDIYTTRESTTSDEQNKGSGTLNEETSSNEDINTTRESTTLDEQNEGAGTSNEETSSNEDINTTGESTTSDEQNDESGTSNEETSSNEETGVSTTPEPPIKSTITPDVLFVKYDIKIESNTSFYPIYCFPKKGTVVKSYKLGKTKLRGFKEESFQNSIEKIFGKDFEVLGNARLNTGIEAQPFEPDIAIISKFDNSIRFDIEIDEPYAGITRQPIHCKGDDRNRDKYFTDRGWIVIRFSEYQVHNYEENCLPFIAYIIKLAIPNYVPPYKEASILKYKLWDRLQAQKWEKEKYREKYLDHEFESIDIGFNYIENDFDQQDIEEEKHVINTKIGECDTNIISGYNIINKHERDNRIKFYPEPHTYTIDGVPAISVSTIISNFFPEFDTKYHAAKKAIELGMTPEHVEEMWRKKGEKSANDGKFLHEQIENYFLNKPYKVSKEFYLFEKFISEHKHIKPFRSEWTIFDEKHLIAGTIDLLGKNGDNYEIYDWKRSSKIIDKITLEPKVDNLFQCGVGKLSHLSDTSYNRYCLQQSLYKYIIEKNYWYKVSKMYLVVLHPDYSNYYKLEVPYLEKEIKYILEALKIQS